jgi:hypothetical protein
MSRLHCYCRLRRLFLTVLCMALLDIRGVNAHEGDVQIVSVTEEWEMSVGEPNQGENGPQVTMLMAPDGNLDGDYFAFNLNFRQWPAYVAGGLQVMRFDGDNIEDYVSCSQHQQIASDHEIIRWQQRVYLHEGSLEFEVLNGSSTTWGSFGGSSLRLSHGTSMQSLNNYTPLLSIAESGVGFAGNRVQSLRLMKVILKISTGEEFEIKAPIDIDTDLDPWN